MDREASAELHRYKDRSFAPRLKPAGSLHPGRLYRVLIEDRWWYGAGRRLSGGHHPTSSPSERLPPDSVSPSFKRTVVSASRLLVCGRPSALTAVTVLTTG